MELNVDGFTVYVNTGGQDYTADKLALIFVHGGGNDHTYWSLQSRFFAHHGYSTLVPDLPGHGRSDGPAPDNIDDYASWLWRFADAIGARTVAFVGHSMGALVALEAAAAMGDGALALIMLGVVPAMGVHPDLQAAADTGHHRAVETMIGWGFGRPSQIGGNRAPGSWVSGAGLRVLERGLRGPLGTDLRASNSYGGAIEAASGVSCPTLVIGGDDDRMTPPKGVGPLIEALADARLTVLPATGHMMSLERPDETLDTMRHFLKGKGE